MTAPTQPPTPEQQARDLLEQMGIKDAQSWPTGDLVPLANKLRELQPPPADGGTPRVDALDYGDQAPFNNGRLDGYGKLWALVRQLERELQQAQRAIAESCDEQRGEYWPCERSARAERERDEALRSAASWASSFNRAEEQLQQAQRERDEQRDLAYRWKQECSMWRARAEADQAELAGEREALRLCREALRDVVTDYEYLSLGEVAPGTIERCRVLAEPDRWQEAEDKLRAGLEHREARKQSSD